MHFRIRKNIVQLVRNTYDSSTQKAVASVVTRMPLTDPQLTPDIESLLTSDEINEVHRWIESQHRISTLRQELDAHELSEKIRSATNWFQKNKEAPTAAVLAPEIVQSWQQLRHLLRKSKLID